MINIGGIMSDHERLEIRRMSLVIGLEALYVRISLHKQLFI